MKKQTDPTQVWEEGLVATEMEAAVMHAYLSDRSPRGDEAHPVKEQKDTGEVQDDLYPILKIEDEAIVDYLLWRGYTLANNFTGTPRWVMWRQSYD